MSVPIGADEDMWEDHEMYREGWNSAEGDWDDLIPYDENTRDESLIAPESEYWEQGYYDFWKTKDFDLGDY